MHSLTLEILSVLNPLTFKQPNRTSRGVLVLLLLLLLVVLLLLLLLLLLED